MAAGIYRIVNTLDRKFYVGSSLNIHARIIAHRSMLRRECHQNIHLQRAWNRDGEGAFLFEIVCECAPTETLVREQEYLDSFETHRRDATMYNIAICAAAPTKGLKASPETRLAMSLGNKGKKRSEETRQRMRKAQGGRICSETTKKNISKSKTGINHPNWGKTLSEETRRKIREGNLAKVRSEETRKKLSEAGKKRYNEAPNDHWRQFTIGRLGKPWTAARRAAHEAKLIKGNSNGL